MPEGWDSDRGGMTVILFVIGANIDPSFVLRMASKKAIIIITFIPTSVS